MKNNQLYSNLVDASSKIVSKFGKGIVYEERFVNILSDLYPSRDNPAIVRVIKTITHEDQLKNVLNSDVKNIEHEIASTVSVLKKKYGYDQTLIEDILFSLAVGCDTISQDQYNVLKGLQKSPSPQKTTPASNPQPNIQSNVSNQKSITDDLPLSQLVLLIWGMSGLLVSPPIYAYLICELKWWPLSTSFTIATLHFFTILPVSAFLDTNSSRKAKRTHKFTQGGFCALFISAIIFWVVFPILFGFEDVQAYWGFSPNKEGFPWLVTIMVNVFCAMILYAALKEGVTNFSVKQHGGTSAKFQELYSSRIFKDGFITVTAIFLLAGLLYYSAPIIKENNHKKEIKTYNEQIEVINQHSDSIRRDRCRTERELSFAQFKLGDPFSTCISNIKSGDKYSAHEKTDYTHIKVNDVDYKDIVNNTIHLETDWDNKRVNIDMFFSNNKLFALQFTLPTTNHYSLFESYISKYGEPECRLKKIDTSEFEKIIHNFSLIDQYLISEHFFWTYKNSMLQIDYCKPDYYFPVEYPYIVEGVTITYFDRIAETILKKHINEQEKQWIIQEQRLNDSLRHIHEKEKLRLERKRKKEEKNHLEAMKQI